MNLFTVLVLFPEYSSEDFPTDIHIESVHASNAFAATRIVQRNAALRCFVPIRQPHDLQVLAVFARQPHLELTAQHFRKSA